MSRPRSTNFLFSKMREPKGLRLKSERDGAAERREDDHSTLDGAERQADQIRDFWRKRGFDIDATPELRASAKAGNGKPFYGVRSSLIGGRPNENKRSPAGAERRVRCAAPAQSSRPPVAGTRATAGAGKFVRLDAELDVVARKLSSAQVEALEWFAEHNGSGVFTGRGAEFLAAGEIAPVAWMSWHKLIEAGCIEKCARRLLITAIGSRLVTAIDRARANGLRLK